MRNVVHNILRRYIILILIFTIYHTTLCDAIPSLSQINGVAWYENIGPNDAYQDGIIYEQDLYGNTESIIKNGTSGMIDFKWKSNDPIGPKQLRTISFYRNGSIYQLVNTKPNTWKEERFDFDINGTFKLIFSYGLSGNISIAFPLSKNAAQPNIIDATKTYPVSILPVNTEISGPAFGIAGSEQSFSIKCSGNANYSIDWGDGQTSEQGSIKDAKPTNMLHKWMDNKEYAIKVNFKNENGEAIGESGLNIKIYDQVTLSNNSLQDVINEIENYTELILINTKYDVDKLHIENKDHILIKSTQNSVLECKKIYINNSNYVNISKLRIESTEDGIIITNSNRLNISYNMIEFAPKKIGIRLISGSNNTLIENILSSKADTLSQIACWGIAIDKSQDNLIKNNIINFIDANNGYHYVIGFKLNNTIQVSDLNENYKDMSKNINVYLGPNGCLYSWNHNGFLKSKQGNGCDKVPYDGDPDDPHRWIY